MEYDIFISYSRKDSLIADKICQALENNGLSFFIDRKGISGGMEFPEQLAHAILNSKVFLFLASENSYTSAYTKTEITFAFNHGCKMLPYIIDKSQLPIHLEFTFSSINWRTLDSHPIDTVLIDDLLNLCKNNSKDINDPSNGSKTVNNGNSKAYERDSYYGNIIDAMGNHYRIGHILGRGCTGVVYYGDDVLNTKPVAIKRCEIVNTAKRTFRNKDHMMFCNDIVKQQKALFASNSTIARSLYHPALAHVRDVVKTDGELFCIMDYVPGQNLSRYIAQHPMNEKTIVTVIKRISSGIKYLHDHKLLHYDIKPHNIMWDEKKRDAMLIDFSTMVRMDTLNSECLWFSTAYAAPELRFHIIGHNENWHYDTLRPLLSPGIDIYSLGATMFHLLTNKYPPVADESVDLKEEISYNLDIIGTTPQLSAIVLKAMEAQSKNRYSSVANLIADLQKLDGLQEEPLYSPMSEEEYLKRETDQERFATTKMLL